MSADNDSSFLFYLLQRSYYLETMCNVPLNYSTMIINSAKVAFLARSSPERLHKTRSAPASASEIHYETRSLRRETLGWGTRTRWHHLFGSFPFLSLFVPDLSLSFFFFNSLNEDCVLVLNPLSHPDEWPQVPWQATFHLLFLLFSPPKTHQSFLNRNLSRMTSFKGIFFFFLNFTAVCGGQRMVLCWLQD